MIFHCGKCNTDTKITKCDPLLRTALDENRATMLCLRCGTAMSLEAEKFIAPAGAPHCHVCLRWVDHLYLVRQSPYITYCRSCLEQEMRTHVYQSVEIDGGKPRKKRNPGTVPSVREIVIVRDRVCRYCGASGNLTFDHLLPKSRGGRRTVANLVLACKPCNQKKANRTPEEAGMTLRPVE